jgi:hypothetical protein
MKQISIKDKSVLVEKYDDEGYNNITVIDNFLPQEMFNGVFDEITNIEHRWQTISTITGEYYADVHNVLADNLNMESVPELNNTQLISVDDDLSFKKINEIDFEEKYVGKLIKKVQEKFNFDETLRIKINQTYNSSKNYVTGFHTDFLLDNIGPWWTAILFLNDSDGGTIFENGIYTECVANRLIVFPGYLLHSGILATNTKHRWVININWYNK